MITTEEARPSAAGQHDGIGDDVASLGHDGADATRGRLDAAHGAACQYGSTESARTVGNRRCSLLRLGAACARRVDASEPRAGSAGQELCHLLARQHAGINLIDAGLIEPSLIGGELGLGATEVYDALGAKARLALDLCIEAPPDPIGLETQLDLSRVTPLRPAPPPIAARLLGAYFSLLAEHDVNAFVGQRECRACADNAAADHHRCRASRNPRITFHRIGTRCRRNSRTDRDLVDHLCAPPVDYQALDCHPTPYYAIANRGDRHCSRAAASLAFSGAPASILRLKCGIPH